VLVVLGAAATTLLLCMVSGGVDTVPLLGAWLVPVAWAATVDAGTSRLPDAIVLTGVAAVVVTLTIVSAMTGEWSLVRSALAGALVLGVPFAVIHVVSPAGFGFGDVKFGVLIGLGLGLVRPGIGVVVFVTAAVLQVMVAVMRPWPAQRTRDANGATAPFGPALAIDAVGWLVVLLVSGGGA
jgi:leader peptidase (prepilin peptidase)/N-methyltransferase